MLAVYGRYALKFKGSILVIDDEESIREMLRAFLIKRNYEVQIAETGAEALDLLEKNMFDVALIDLKLPDYTGLELIDSFHSKCPETKCIVMTAFASLENTIEAFRLNAFDYILKPFDLVKIGEVVDAAYNHAQKVLDNTRKIEALVSTNKELEKSAVELKELMLKTNEELSQANESLKRHVTRLRMLYQMGRDISSNENWSDALDRFLMALCNYMEAEGSGLILFSNEGKKLQVRTSFHLEEDLLTKAVQYLLEAQQKDTLPPETFLLESCRNDAITTCLEMKSPWEHTVIPLLYKGRWLGFLLMHKLYESSRAFLADYHFINTLQTILIEEVANAVNISNLRNLKNFNETILENINSGVLTADNDGKVVFMNSKARAILSEAIDRKIYFDDLFQNPFGGEGLFAYLVSSDERRCSFEGILSLSGDRSIQVRLNTTKIELDEYHGKTIIAIFDDLTEQKAMEEELKTTDRLRSLGELSAGIAHEIRNPLTGIATTAQLLKEKLAEGAGETKYISVILEEIHRLDEIINNLLDFARPISPNATEIPLAALLEETIELLSDASREAGVTLGFHNECKDDRCTLDRDRVKQVILNIALNGIQACSEGGALKVMLRDSENPSFIQMEFADTGEGISAEAAEHLYNPFFTMRQEGTGLGLSISRKIVDSHGGRIYYTSEVGKGTRFFIELPRKLLVSTGQAEARVS